MSKIVQISPYSFDHIGGVEQYAKILQSIFANEMKTLAGGKDFKIIEPVHNCPVPTIWRRGFWKELQKITPKNTKIIISHIRFAPTAWLAFFLARRKKIPYIHIEHGSGFLIHKNFFIAFVAKIVDLTIGKYILKKADYVIAISKHNQKWITETFGRNTNISHIYRGFSFPQISRTHNQIPKIGFAGRLVPLKNLEILIEALSELQAYEWQCEIVGDGKMREKWKNLTKKYKIQHRIKFLGIIPQENLLTKWYPTIDIFVNPSKQEGLPTTIIEASMLGCLTIATNVGGTREIPNISLIKPTTTSLKKILEKALKNEINHPKNTKSPFSLNTMKSEFQNIFSTLISKK